MNAVRWIDSTSWELAFYGLPSHIPWPADVDPALANQEPFDVEHLLKAIELLGDEATEPWSLFLKASDYYSDLLEALQENEIPAALAALSAAERESIREAAAGIGARIRRGDYLTAAIRRVTGTSSS